jgi:hypothetical protein
MLKFLEPNLAFLQKSNFKTELGLMQHSLSSINICEVFIFCYFLQCQDGLADTGGNVGTMEFVSIFTSFATYFDIIRS